MAAAIVNGESSKATTVCVTGATGFLASSLVKHLLHIGYTVHATVRDPENEIKVRHLLDIAGAEERLELFRADLWDDGSFDSTIDGCNGVFHLASPVDFAPKDPEFCMVTGDNIYTAKSIALECGILQTGHPTEELAIIERQIFRIYTKEERMKIVDKICVMGRYSPIDKIYFVQALRKRGHVVVVTGDGTNDAPALHEADIGLSMGTQGTKVAKESSDIIIIEDNFASIVKVVRWGRSVYANIQKFIQFQLTVNVAAIVINFFADISSGDVPLSEVQLLWVNLIMDTLGALTLETKSPTDHLMHHPPIERM